MLTTRYTEKWRANGKIGQQGLTTNGNRQA
jgi:hypothetical protein